MTYSIELSELAIDDIAEIQDWYRDHLNGLEKQFIVSLEGAFDQIAKNPLAFQVRIKQSRNILLKRFPYKVIFKIYGSTIKIVAIIHHSRNPKSVRKRLK